MKDTVSVTVHRAAQLCCGVLCCAALLRGVRFKMQDRHNCCTAVQVCAVLCCAVVCCPTALGACAHRHDANLALPWLDDAWAVGANQPRLVLFTHNLLHLHLHRVMTLRTRNKVIKAHMHMWGCGQCWQKQKLARAAASVICCSCIGLDHHITSYSLDMCRRYSLLCCRQPRPCLLLAN